MNTEKTFIGFNKDGKGILVYRKDDNTYINLLSKDNSVYPICDIDLISLIPYSKLIKAFKYKSKNSIIRKYNKNIEKRINRNKIKLGKICSISNLKVEINQNLDVSYIWDGVVLRQDFFIKKGKKYKCIRTNQNYYINGKIPFRKLKNGNLYVKPAEVIGPTLVKDYFKEYPTKKEIIEVSYSLKNK